MHREGYHSRNAVASELAWIDALRGDGAVVTPTPDLPGRTASPSSSSPTRPSPRPRHAVLFAWEEGEEPDEEQQDLRGPFEVLGEITARMHVHMHGTGSGPPGFERFTWDFETTLGRPSSLGLVARRHGAHAGDRGPVRPNHRPRRPAARTVFGSSPERFNLIHCDMRLANLLIDGATTKVIDFDDCGLSWLMYDCATTVSFFEHKPEVPELVAAWLRGYRRVIDLPRADEDEIPTFIMLRRLLLVAWIGSHSETELAQSMGVEYTEGTVPLCEDYLSRF